MTTTKALKLTAFERELLNQVIILPKEEYFSLIVSKTIHIEDLYIGKLPDEEEHSWVCVGVLFYDANQKITLNEVNGVKPVYYIYSTFSHKLYREMSLTCVYKVVEAIKKDFAICKHEEVEYNKRIEAEKLKESSEQQAA